MARPTRPAAQAGNNTLPKRTPAAMKAGTIHSSSSSNNNSDNNRNNSNTVRGSSIRPPSRQQMETPAQSGNRDAPTNYHKRPSSPMSTGPPSKRRQADLDEGQSVVIDPKATNIQVVVRCRGRSEREVKENSPVVVTATGGLRGKEITVSNGPVPPLSNKTYTFDRVFGPEANQEMIYDDVVSPFLDEVLAGYNCTIFAYGQTGTGKTYTMTGDLSEHHRTYSIEAGIIPRTLHRLFHALDADGSEYSVKVSFIELYNEELRDLLGADDDKKVKLYEENRKVVIQGMEEGLVMSAEDGVNRLRIGNHRRQVAATKCNDLSSRSHTVFTITVYLKEATEGEDMVKVGKLNLVDLAGSESIGRSGAVDKRAREAGMINQSLLTLGRVINALVEGSQHIPYRESKLTRLLQDSLGGRTKTCIIATVSPAKVNIEETLSTLEYANKAKSIHNKPQINQMMTKKALIREYVTEIEKLKSDLRAARSKNGIYLSEESYQELNAQNLSRGQLIEEQERKIEALETQLKASREQFEAQWKTLLDTKKDLERVSKNLDETKERLADTEKELTTTKNQLSEQILFRKAHQETETKLNTMCNELKCTLESTTADLRGYQEKLGRKAQVEEENKAQWKNVQQDLIKLASSLEQRIQTMSSFQTSKSTEMEKMIASFLEMEANQLDGIHHFVDSQLSLLEQQHRHFESDLSDAKSTGDVILGEIKGVREDIKRKVSEGLTSLNAASETISQGIVDALVDFQQETHDAYLQIGHSLKSLFNVTQRHISGQMAEMTQFRHDINVSERANLCAIDEISVALDAALAQERERAEQEKARFTTDMVALIDALIEGQQSRWSTAVEQTRQGLATSQNKVQAGYQLVSRGLDTWAERETSFSKEILGNKDEVKKSIVDAAKAADQRGNSIQESARRVHAQTIELVDTQMKALDEKTQALDDFVLKARGHAASRYQRHEVCLSEVASTFRASASRVQEDVARTRKSLTTNTVAVTGNSTSRIDNVNDFTHHSSETVKSLRHKVLKHELLDDIPTSETPKKREYYIPTSFPSTRPEEVLSHANKMPLGNVDINLTGQTPATVSRVRHFRLGEQGVLENSFEKKTVTPTLEKSAVIERIGSEGTENSSAFQSRIIAPSTRKRPLGSH